MAANDHITALVAWATKHGAKLHPSVQVYQDPQTGLSFRVKPDAAASTAPYEPVVTIPTSLTLSYLDAISDKDSNPFPRDFLDQAPPHVVGRLFLVKEYLKGQDSFWWPYIQALPQPDDRESWALPPFWDAEEAELLDGTNVEVGLDKIRGDVKKEFKEAQELLSIGDAGNKFAQVLSVALYQWAYCIFSSRSFRPSLVLSAEQQATLPKRVTMNDFSVLLPLFDIGNHDMTTDVQWNLGEDENSCELRVGKGYAPGEQVFNNYSMKTNAELLLGYGFMVPATDDLHNDYTHVRKRTDAATTSEEYLISARPIRHRSSLLARSKQVLRLPDSVPVIATFQNVQADMVWDIFCTLTQPEQRDALFPRHDAHDEAATERQRQELFFSGKMEGEGRMYLEQTAAIIQHKILQELERLNETDVEVAGEDAHLLTGNQRLALEYRERCRLVLESTLEVMGEDEVLNGMDEEE